MINQNPQNEKDTSSPRGMLKLKSLNSLVQSDVKTGSVQQSPQIVKRVSALPPGRSMKFEDYLAKGFGTEEDFWQEEFVVKLRMEVDAGLVRANEAAFFLGITSYLWQHGCQGCISCGILVSGIGARGVSSEHMENMEMFSLSPT